ncbi:hypothetical protein AVEN_224863-1 [Araneus ventricosus]|uniref:Uncharacterized protein n=1 Tax=Araneus ventricosus TaxID=182803 RepID=A0A4Y2RIT6_ARAVE|nr:hypothetical protein AVEN_224863-1 [Araneus ventricosus]
MGYWQQPGLDTLATNLATTLANWREIWRLPRRNMGSQMCWNFLDISIRRGDMLKCTSDVTACRGRLYEECAWTTEGVNIDRLGSSWSAKDFGVLSSVRANKLLGA